jgi:hypothetical protein
VTSRAKMATTAITEPPVHQRSSCGRRATEFRIQRLLRVDGEVWELATRCRRGIAGLVGALGD